MFEVSMMRTADEILKQAKRLSPEERRRVAEELLDELDHTAGVSEEARPNEGPYSRWLKAAGSVRSEFKDLSTDKYKHVGTASLHGHDEA
ncbi:MAG: hypothetical protein M5R36_10850 [Deltaproteobacteria bacterium]|nr:hypothetical protein [Deltaproteobacteria bacterium]